MMNLTRLSILARGVLLASLVTNAEAQWVGVSKGSEAPGRTVLLGWSVWNQACNNYIYGYGSIPVPTYDIRSGNSTVALTHGDIWYAPTEEGAEGKSSHVLIGIDNAYSYDFTTHLYGPRWIPAGIWGYRVKYKDGSAVTDKGIPIAASIDGSSQYFTKSILPVDEIKEDEVFYELMDQAGGIIGKFRVTLPDCASCETAMCDVKPDIGSVEYGIPIGLSDPRTGFQGRPCSLRFYQEQIPLIGKNSISLVSPESGDPSVVTTHGADGALETIRVGEMFTRIEQLEGGALPISLTITVSLDWQNPTTTVFRTVTITSKVDASGSPYLEFDDLVNGTHTLTAYRQGPAGDWIMDTANGARRETHSVAETTTERVVRRTVAERVSTSPDTYSVVSDEATTYVPGPSGWEQSSTVTDPDGHAITMVTSYYRPGEDTSPNGSSSSAGVGRLKQIQHPTGEMERHYYFDYPTGSLFDSAHVVRRAFAGTQEHRETTTETATGLSPETGRELIVTRVTERVGTQVVSRVESSREDVVSAGFSGYITETRTYSGPTTFTSTYTFDSIGIDESTTVVNSDGTASISTRVIDASSGYTTHKSVSGYVHDDPASGLPRIVMVNMSESITDKFGENIAVSNYRYKDGEQILVSRKLATEFDARHRVTRFENFVDGNDNPVFVTEREYGCCGIIRERDEDGVDTHYGYDAHKRVVTTNRAGVTTETVRAGLTTSQHRYAQSIPTGGTLTLPGSASAANEISRSVTNLLGDTVEEWNRSPQDGTLVKTTIQTSYNVGGGIGRRVVTLPPVVADDGAATPSQTDAFFLDGNPASSTGNLGRHRGYRYSATATGLATESFLMDGTVEKENTTTQSDWALRQTSVVYSSDMDGVGGNDHADSFYNASGQITKTVDPDGVTQIYGYNLRGEQTFTALDLNGNGLIDLAADRISFSETDLVQRQGGEWVMRTTRKDWLNAESDTGTATSHSDVSLDGLRRWSIQHPAVQTRETKSVTTLGGSGTRTQVLTRPDDTSLTTTMINGRITNGTEKGADGLLLYQTDYGYDPLNRLHTLIDSRSGTTIQHYVSATSDVVNRTVDHQNRETLISFDHRGRPKSVDLPDTVDENNNPVTNVSTIHHYPDGNIHEQTGDGNYRTTWTYDYADRAATMTTYGTVSAVTRWVYDSRSGFLTGKLYNSPTPGSGTGPSYTYSAAGRVKTRTQARQVSGQPLVTTYNYGTANGSSAADLDKITHSDGTPGYSITTRDRFGRAKEMQDAAGDRTFDYTRHGDLKSETFTSGILGGQKIEQEFDSLLRTRSHTASFGTEALGTATYGYGPSGAVRTVSGNGQSATYHYHAIKRVLERVTYSKEGETSPWLESTRKYDALNRLTRITTHADDAGVQKAVDHHAYDYDALDRIGSHADMTGAAWTYGYNAKGEVSKATKLLPGGTTQVNGRAYRYHFDGIGNRTEVEQSRDSSQTVRRFIYTPDALNQYSAITHPSFVDVAGFAAPSATVTVNSQPVTRQGGHFRKELSKDNSSGPQWIDASVTDGTTTTDGSLALPAISVAPEYDDDGNLKFDGLWNYTWDAENRLIRCERSAALVSAGAPYLKLEYDYDSQSRRIRSSTFTSSGANSPTSQTLFVFDGWKCVAELDALSGNQPIRKYTWGLDLEGDIGDSSTGNVGALLWLVDTAVNNTHVHLYDENGNVSGLVDSTTRKRSATYDYDAFGQLTVSHGVYAKKNPFTFSTKHTDFATGLRYYGYRWYSPMHGRWLSRDPIKENGGVNLYGFVYNDPLGWYDDLGGMPKSKGGFTPRSKIIMPTPIGDPTLIPRKIIGTGGSIFTGDIFHKPNSTPGYGGSQCKFLFTVTGINMRGDTQKDFHDQVGDLTPFKDIHNTHWVNNPSNYPLGPFGGGDIVQILLNELTMAITVADQEMAKQIKSSATKAKENGCCCWSIHVVAHSQGTMVFRRAMNLLDTDTKKHIHFTGLGGQTIIGPNEGLGSVENIAEQQDPVPKLNPLNWSRFRREFDDQSANGGSDSHSWRDVYIPYLNSNSYLLKGRVDCE